MKFSLFMLLLEFIPERIQLVYKGKPLGDYNGKEFFWSDTDVQNMQVEPVEISFLTKRIILEVK